MSIVLRPYQQTALDSIRRSLGSGCRAPLLVSPTGSGKTVLFTSIADGAARKGKRVLILVHRAELLAQASASLDRLGVGHGLISPRFSMTSDHVQVASVQTVVRRLERMHKPDIIVIDECHHSVAGSWRKVIDAFPSAKILGVTATPCRLSGEALGVNSGGIFDDIVFGPSYQELQALGYLVRPRVFAPSTIDTTGVHRIAGDFNKAELAAVTDKPTITGDAVSHYSKLCGGSKAVAFCVSLKHAEHVTEAFKAAGYQWAQIDGTLDDADRKRIIRDLASGALHGISSVDIVSEGFDLPDISTAILLRKTQSLGLYLQQVGRCSRPAPGKDSFIVLDHVGNCLRHGMPDEDREWSRDGEQGKKKKDEEESVKQCKACFCTYSIREPVCPECGLEPETKTRPPPIQVDGELAEVTPEQIEAARRVKKKEESMCMSLEDFQKVAAARGYSPGWARIRWGLRMKRGASSATQDGAAHA